MTRNIAIRLSTMMFLEFFIWGGWFVTLGTFLLNNLDASGAQAALAYSTQSWGAIVAPFFIGLIADRFFNAERILGVLHIIGGILMYLMANASDFGVFYPYVLAYMIAYMPTLALVNAVAFRQMDDPSKDFSRIRVWGTAGWIVAGWVISFVFSWDAPQAIAAGMLKNTFLLVSVASFVLGFFSLTLPKTPPTADKGQVSISDILGLDALKLLRDKNFALFFLSSILICIPLAFYYQNTNPFLTEIGVSNATGMMTMGQGSEIVFMLLLPLFLKRFGIKTTLLVGMAAWALRYVFFAYGNADGLFFMLLMGILLHGICYDFFFVSGQIYTDSKAGNKYKSAAQGLITLATYGLGMLIGFWAAGEITDMNISDDGHNWASIWIMPGIFSAGVLLLFLVSFKNETIAYN